jgi:hypothetical protein
VAIRLDVFERNGDKVVRVAGHLKGEDVGVCDDAISEVTPPFELELGDLLYADAEGLELLRRLRERGVQLAHVPELVRLQLK